MSGREVNLTITKEEDSDETAEIKEIARRHGIKVGQMMKKADIIRAIQQAEGNEACFASGKVDVCGQTNCLWREDCH